MASHCLIIYLMSKFIQIIITTPTKDKAEKITDELMNKRLASCVQITSPIESHYWWKGKIEKAEERQCIIKTKSNLYRNVEKEILKIHPYEVPEIIMIPIIDGYKKYLNWIDKETCIREK